MLKSRGNASLKSRLWHAKNQENTYLKNAQTHTVEQEEAKKLNIS